MFWKKERQIANQQAMIKNRDILIGDMEKQAKVLYEEKKELHFENVEQRMLIDEIKTILFKEGQGTIVDRFNKIKELFTDDQSDK